MTFNFLLLSLPTRLILNSHLRLVEKLIPKLHFLHFNHFLSSCKIVLLISLLYSVQSEFGKNRNYFNNYLKIDVIIKIGRSYKLLYCPQLKFFCVKILTKFGISYIFHFSFFTTILPYFSFTPYLLKEVVDIAMKKRKLFALRCGNEIRERG